MALVAIPTRTLREELTRAIPAGDIDTVRRVLESGFHPDTNINGSETGLIAACRNAQEPIARLFLEKGAKLEHRNQYTVTAFLYACKYLPDFAIEMAEMDADINHIHKDNLLVPLITAIEQGHDRLVDYLLSRRDIELEVYNERKESPAVVAALHNRRFLPKLVEAGCDVNWRGRPLQPVLHQVFSDSLSNRQGLSAMLILIGAGARIHDVDHEQTLLPSTVRRRHPEIVHIVDKVYRAPACKPESLRDATKQSLLEDEYSLLDNPRTWWQFDALQTELEKKGEALSVEDLTKPNQAPDGKHYLSFAIRCAGFEMMRAMLEAHGQQIPSALLVDDKGKATPMFEQIVADGGAREVFTAEYWKDHSSQDLRHAYAALPDKVRKDVPIHQLVSWKKRQESLAARAAGGGMTYAS